MKKLVISFLILSILSSKISAQNWKSNNGNLISNTNIIIGGSEHSKKDDAKLSIYSGESKIGGTTGIMSSHWANSDYLSFSTLSKIGYTSLWPEQAQCAAFAGNLKIKTDNSYNHNSHSSAGQFILQFDEYKPYNISDNIHFLGGSYNSIKGYIAQFPTKSVIAAVIGNDQINKNSTYAGYFLGKGYFSKNVGIGTKEPTTKLEIAKGDVYISDISRGIIMKSPDGQCWRGTLNNKGKLSFNKIECPEIEE